jgi:ribonuclease-3
VVNSIVQSIRLLFCRNKRLYGLSFSQLGFIPGNRNLYRLALLHKSASQQTKDGRVLNYERLEFLGDAVLGAIVAELLYKYFPDKDEGFLTQVRSRMVSRETLNSLAIEIGLDKGVVAHSDISKNKHVYGDVFEAFMGAMFLDQGFAVTKRFIEKFIFPNYYDIKNLVTVDTNYKSRLIEWGQKNKVDLRLETVNSTSRRGGFCCTVIIENVPRMKGFGGSKKEAERDAACKLMKELDPELSA